MTAYRSDSPPATIAEARSLALVNERAQRLFDDGYRARWIDSAMVEMDSPAGGIYDLDTAERTCSCPYFQKAKANGRRGESRTCKHLLGLSKLLERQEAAVLLLALRRHNQVNWEALT